jgi:hypothetical protein
VFGSTWKVNSGRVFYMSSGGSLDLDIAKVDDDGALLS